MNTQAKKFGYRSAALILMVAALLFGGIGITGAAARSAIPGDALYPLKTTIEQTRLSLARDAGDRAQMKMGFAEQRLEEIAKLIEEGRYTEVNEAVLAFEADINSAILELETVAQVDPARAAQIALEITEALTRYAQTLSGMAASAPEGIRQEVTRALDSTWTASGLEMPSDDGQDDDGSANVNGNADDHGADDNANSNGSVDDNSNANGSDDNGNDSLDDSSNTNGDDQNGNTQGDDDNSNDNGDDASNDNGGDDHGNDSGVDNSNDSGGDDSIGSGDNSNDNSGDDSIGSGDNANDQGDDDKSYDNGDDGSNNNGSDDQGNDSGGGSDNSNDSGGNDGGSGDNSNDHGGDDSGGGGDKGNDNSSDSGGNF